MGTVSHGIKCAYPNLPGVYMRMTFYRPWIEKVHNALSTTWPSSPGGPNSVEQYVTSYLGINPQAVEAYRKTMLEENV